MKKNEKDALIKLVGGLGFIVFLVGLFTSMYEFMHGLIVAIAIWIIAEAMKMYIGVDRPARRRTSRRSSRSRSSRRRSSRSSSRRRRRR